MDWNTAYESSRNDRLRVALLASRAALQYILGIEISNETDETVGLKRKSGEAPHERFKRIIGPWTKGKRLGGGSFGTVYECISSDGSVFAVKKIVTDEGCNAKRSTQQLQKEVSLLSRLQHENIVQYYGTDTKDGNLYIFLELVIPGSLASLYGRHGRFPDSQVSVYTKQILNGLIYLHNNNIMHRDIKCANILVNSDGRVKLADFGVAKEMDTLTEAKSFQGTVFWTAPEVVNALKDGRPYGPPADIWSVGCTVLEMLTGNHPYPELTWYQALFKIGNKEKPPIPDTLSAAATDFINRCLTVDPRKRPSAAELLDDLFLR